MIRWRWALLFGVVLGGGLGALAFRFRQPLYLVIVTLLAGAILALRTSQRRGMSRPRMLVALLLAVIMWTCWIIYVRTSS